MNAKVNPKNPMMAVLIVFFMVSTGMGVAGYFYLSSEKAKLKNRESEIQSLKTLETTLHRRIEDAETEGKKLIEENTALKQSLEKFENEKTVILNQVRSSVASFETFREQATTEIENLKKGVNELEAEKEDLTQKLETTQGVSAADKERMSKEIEVLNQKINEHQAMGLRLVESLKGKDNTSMVHETSKLHYNLGNFYFRSGQFQSAAREYKKAIFYTGDDADAHWNLAVVSEDYLGDKRTALEHFKRYLELRPKSAEAKLLPQRILDLEMTLNVMQDNPPVERKPSVNEEGLFDKDKDNMASMKLMRDK